MRITTLSLLAIGTLAGTFLNAFGSTAIAAEMESESDIKFAIYSRAWGANTDDGMRVVVNNQTDSAVQLHSVAFLKDGMEASEVSLDFDLRIAPGAYAETDLEYIDLLDNDECVSRTMAENWKLVEISNYTLNPSVRGLIIEDTDSFRIYQCVETVITTWSDLQSDIRYQKEEWVLFHFESRRN
jgi:hypothetical protein